MRACVLFVVAALASSAAAQERKPPKRAEVPFRVHVLSSAQGEPDVVEAIHEARDELAKRLEKNGRWFEVVDSLEAAEIVVDLQAYWVREQTRMHDQRHVAGANSHTMQVETVYQHHSVRARTSFLGRQRELTGTETKRGRGSAKGAAKDLAKRLERHVKDNYWDLAERRSSE